MCSKATSNMSAKNNVLLVIAFPKIFTKFASNSFLTHMENDLNRIKIVLAEKKRTNKWLAEQLGKDPATVSKWCTNTAQPGLETLREISNLLEVDIRYLIHPTMIASEPEVMYVKVKQ